MFQKIKQTINWKKTWIKTFEETIITFVNKKLNNRANAYSYDSFSQSSWIVLF